MGDGVRLLKLTTGLSCCAATISWYSAGESIGEASCASASLSRDTPTRLDQKTSRNRIESRAVREKMRLHNVEKEARRLSK